MANWSDQFRVRMETFGGARRAAPGEVPVSIKVRVTSGCFHREHSPHAYALIDAELQQADLGADRLAFEEHESGPEVLAYVAFAAAGISLAKSVIDLVVAILKARSESVRKGDRPSDPLEVVVRRFDESGQVRDEIAFRMGHADPIRRAEVEQQLLDALNRLLRPKAAADKPADKRRLAPPKGRRRR
ncbi:MAG: hypothetical protein AAB403_19050 [Planctomycetota bacterium]